MNNRVRRNIWLIFAILSFGAVVNRAIRVADGSVEWWSLVCSILITVFCVKFYLCYRAQVKKGNIYGRVRR